MFQRKGDSRLVLCLLWSIECGHATMCRRRKSMQGRLWEDMMGGVKCKPARVGWLQGGGRGECFSGKEIHGWFYACCGALSADMLQCAGAGNPCRAVCGRA